MTGRTALTFSTALPTATRLVFLSLPTALTGLLKDESPWARAGAARALGRIGGSAKATAPALTELLKDQNEGVRRDAAEALGRFGADSKAAVPP